jgi:elongation factor P
MVVPAHLAIEVKRAYDGRTAGRDPPSAAAIHRKNREFPMVKATQLRPGMIIRHEGDLYSIFSVDHRTPGNKRGSMQTRMRNLRNGMMLDYRFRAEETLERAILDEIDYEFLYSDGDGHHFMNTENYEQTTLQHDILGDTVNYLTPNLPVKLEFYEGKPTAVLLPDTVDLTVVDTEPSIQKATASAVMKPAKLETGLIINVPPFVGNGDKVKVDTTEARYIQRVQ